jgi:hypothetical protein
MKRLSRCFPYWSGAFLLLGLAPAQAAPEPRQTGAIVQRYVVAGPRGARVRNLADDRANVVLDVAPGGILAVYVERDEWLHVESPGGFQVWVFGQYLRPTDIPNTFEVRGSNVLMRPKPSSGPDSYPLEQRLFTGDRVRFISRQDPSKPWEEDWIAVYSPPGTRALVRASETQALPAGVDGAAQWRTAAAAAMTQVPADAARAQSTSGGGAAKPMAEKDVVAALRAADELFSAQRSSPSPDIEGVRAAYQAVLTDAQGSQSEEVVRSRLAEVDAFAELLALRGELEAERVRRQQALNEREEMLETAAKRGADPFAGRFAARGWLERRQEGEVTMYELVFGGHVVSMLECSSGRYDLNDFIGYELGVLGASLRSGIPAADEADVGVPSIVDVSRIEVIAGRAAR